jgi:hypothetical protein
MITQDSLIGFPNELIITIGNGFLPIYEIPGSPQRCLDKTIYYPVQVRPGNLSKKLLCKSSDTCVHFRSEFFRPGPDFIRPIAGDQFFPSVEQKNTGLSWMLPRPFKGIKRSVQAVA